MTEQEQRLLDCLEEYFKTVTIDNIDEAWKDARLLYNTLRLKKHVHEARLVGAARH